MSTTIRSDTVRQASAGRAGGTAGPHNSKSVATVAFTDHAAPHARLYQPDGGPLPGPESYPGDTGADWTGLAFSPDGLYLAACLQAPPAGFYTNVAWWKKTGSWEPMPPPAADVVAYKTASNLQPGETYRWGTQPRKTVETRGGGSPVLVIHTDGTTVELLTNQEVQIVDQILPALSQLLWSPDGVHLAGIRTVTRTGATQTYKLAVFRRVGDTLTWLPEDISLRDRAGAAPNSTELPGFEPAFDLTWADADTVVITHNGLYVTVGEF